MRLAHEQTQRDYEHLISRRQLEKEELKHLHGHEQSLVKEVTEFKQQIDQSEIEKRRLINVIDKQHADIDRLDIELKTLAENHQEAKQRENQLNETVHGLSSRDMTLTFQKTQLEHEVSMMKKQIEWLDGELNRRSEEFSNYRSEKSTQLGQLQTRLDESLQEVDRLGELQKNLKEKNEKFSRKLEESFDKIKELQMELGMNEERFRQEIGTQLRLTELYKGGMEDTQRKSEMLESSIREFQKTLDQLRMAVLESEKMKADLETRLGERESRIGQLEEELAAINTMLGGGDSVRELRARGRKAISRETSPSKQVTISESEDRPTGSLFPISPTVLLASRVQKSGKTFSEIYHDYMRVSDELTREKQENTRLSECLSQILREIQEKAPILRQQRLDYEQALSTIDDLGAQLEKSLAKQDELTFRWVDSEKHRERLERESHELQIEIKDLSQQIHILLGELHSQEVVAVDRRDDEHVELEETRGGMLGAATHEEPLDSDRVISIHLISFRNIEELQIRNQELIRVVRRLSERLEQQTSKEDDGVHLENGTFPTSRRDREEKLETLMRELEELRQSRSRQQTLVTSLIQQRDIYRAMIRPGDEEALSDEMRKYPLPMVAATPSTDREPEPMSSRMTFATAMMGRSGPTDAATHTITPTPTTTMTTAIVGDDVADIRQFMSAKEAEYERFRKDRLAFEKTLQEQLDRAQKEAFDAKLDLAKSTAQLGCLEERYQLLITSSETQSKQIEDLRKRLADNGASLILHQKQIQQHLQESLNLRDQCERLQRQLGHVEAERDLRRSNEERLWQENSTLLVERSRLDEVLRHVQHLHEELERNDNESKRKLETRAISLESELTGLRQQLQEELSNYRELSLRKESEAREYQYRIDKLNEELRQIREGLLHSQAQVEHMSRLNADLQQEQRDLRSQSRRESWLVPAPSATSAAAIEAISPAKETTAPDAATLSSEQPRALQEITELRLELENATDLADQYRQHLEQYQTIAKTHEDALAELSEAFDTYKAHVETELSEKEERLMQATSRCASLEQDLQQALREQHLLQQNLDEEKSRQRTEHDQLVEDLEHIRQEKMGFESREARWQDAIREHARLANEAQSYYERELMMHASDVQALTELKGETVRLQQTLHETECHDKQASEELEHSRHAWETQKTLLENTIHELESRLDGYATHQQVLLTQLETITKQRERLQKRINMDLATSPPTTETTGAASRTPRHETISAEEGGPTSPSPTTGEVEPIETEDWSRIIRFLRRERDLLQCHLEVAQQESIRLKLQLDQTTSSLEETRQLLESERRQVEWRQQTRAQHEELMRKINDLNLLRESNATLREELQRESNHTRELEQLLSTMNKQVEALTAENRDVGAELEAISLEKQRLVEENQKWRLRLQQLLDTYERIDPEEHKHLKEELSQLTEETTSLRSRISTLEQQVHDEHKANETLRQSLDTKQAELEQADNRIKKLKAHCQYWKTETEKATKRLEEQQQQQLETTEERQLQATTASTRALQEELDQIRQQKVDLERRAEELTQSQTELEHDRDEKVAKMRKMLEILQKTRADFQSKTETIEQLRKDNERLEHELESVRAILREKESALRQDVERERLRANLMISKWESQAKKLQEALRAHAQAADIVEIDTMKVPSTEVDVEKLEAPPSSLLKRKSVAGPESPTTVSVGKRARAFPTHDQGTEEKEIGDEGQPSIEQSPRPSAESEDEHLIDSEWPIPSKFDPLWLVYVSLWREKKSIAALTNPIDRSIRFYTMIDVTKENSMLTSISFALL